MSSTSTWKLQQKIRHLMLEMMQPRYSRPSTYKNDISCFSEELKYKQPIIVLLIHTYIQKKITCMCNIPREYCMFQTCECSIFHQEYIHQQSPPQAHQAKRKIVDISNFPPLKYTTAYSNCSKEFITPSMIQLFDLIGYANLPFWRTFLHMVALRLPKCFRSFSILQSVIGKDLLSKGSAHFGSPSDRQTQHFIESPIDKQANHICNKTMLQQK